MRNVSACIPWLAATLTVGAVACGGATNTLGGSDASVDGSRDSGSGSGSGGGSGGSSGGGSGGSGGSSSSGSSSGGGMGGNCPMCFGGFLCCDGVTCNVDSYNDPLNCGACGDVCPKATPYCGDGKCMVAPCEDQDCGPDSTCCGKSCCKTGDICCEQEGPVAGGPVCYTPTAQEPSCPPGCMACALR